METAIELHVYSFIVKRYYLVDMFNNTKVRIRKKVFNILRYGNDIFYH